MLKAKQDENLIEMLRFAEPSQNMGECAVKESYLCIHEIDNIDSFPVTKDLL